MAKQLSSKNTLLFATGAVPTATEVITTSNNVIVNPKPKAIEYKDIGNGQAGNSKTFINNDFVTAEFSVELVSKSSGALGVAPTYADLFKCCGLSETITASTDVVYKPELVEQAGTALSYVDGYKRQIDGIAGDFSFSGKVGELAKFSFNLKGFTTLEPIAEANPAVTLDANKNLIVTSASVITVGGGTIALDSFEFSLGNETKEIYAVGSKEYFIGDFKPTLKVTAVKTKGNDEHWADLNANTKKEVIITLGDTAGDIIEFKASYCQPSDANESDDGGSLIYDRTWVCENSAGGDNFSVTYK